MFSDTSSDIRMSLEMEIFAFAALFREISHYFSRFDIKIHCATMIENI